MKFILIVLAIGLGLFAIIYAFSPWEYSEAETEAAFAKIAKDGFDKETTRKLLGQYRVSDASFRIHFIATGHIAALKNPKAFDQPYNEKWAALVKEIEDDGQAAAGDWFNPDKYSEMRVQLGYSPTAR